MQQPIHVCIGIQARSTSSRLPNKISRLIKGKMVIDHVIDACKNSAAYINRYSYTNHISCSVFVLIPKNDPIKPSLLLQDGAVIEGPEDDVLARYVLMAKENHANYVVRITADCPLIPPFLIFKCINAAIKNGFDYFSNVGDLGPDSIRTSIDGHDVEVMSARALDWLDKTAKPGPEREHVTLRLRDDHVPHHIRRGVLIGHNDHSDIKLSIDTEEDFKRVEEEYERLQKKIEIGKRKFGKNAVHRF